MEGVGWLSRRISDFLFKHHLNEMIQGKQDKALHRAGWAAAASSCLLYLPLPSPGLFGGVREMGWGGKEIKKKIQDYIEVTAQVHRQLRTARGRLEYSGNCQKEHAQTLL